MTKYLFDGNSPVYEVEVVHTAGGGVRAYLRAHENSDLKTLENIKDFLTEHSMKWTPVIHEDKPALEVRSIGRNGKELLELLKQQGAVSGHLRAEKNPENQKSWWEKLKANTLRWSGFSYFIGDVGFMTYGWKDAFAKDASGKNKLVNPQNLLAGISYAAGTPFIVIFGTGDKSDVQLRHMSYDIRTHLENKGIQVPEDSSIHSVTHEHNTTLWKKIISKCERYPAEIANSFYGLAGSMIVWDSAKHIGKFKQETAAGVAHSKNMSAILLDIGLGVMSVAAALVSVFVEEEKPNPEEPKKTGFGRVWQWVKEKPLRTAGLLLGIATVNHAFSTAISYRETGKILKDASSTAEQISTAKKDRSALPGRAVFVATNVAAEGLMTVSSKGHGEGVISDKSLEPSTYAIMADLIRRYPQEKHEYMLDLISSLLANKENLNTDEDIIRKGIVLQMEKMNKNPWAVTGNPAGTTRPERQAQAASSAQGAKWQHMVNHPELAANSPAF